MFVDECSAHTSMTRRRAARGTRARGAVPRNRGPVTTLLAGLSLAGMSSAMTIEGGTDTAMFATHLDHFLLPALSPGQMVVVDNVVAHKPDRIRQLVDAAGCELVFLPAYSPHLCPIEEAFSKLKALMRAVAACTRAALDAAIAAALQAVTPADAAGWFGHAGYPTRKLPENRCHPAGLPALRRPPVRPRRHARGAVADEPGAGPRPVCRHHGVAMTAGVVAFVLPSGIGAREVVIVGALAAVLPYGQALALVVSRAMFTVVELVSAGVATLGAQLATRRAARA
jgi:transposase